LAERVLVTGASGFIGSHVARRLVRDGAHVLALVRPGSDLWRLADVAAEVELVHGDLAHDDLPDPGPLDRVLHLAAAGVGDGAAPDVIIAANVLGTQHALDLGRSSGAGAFLYCGSCFEYGPGERHREDAELRPISVYGASKSAGWLLTQAFARQHDVAVSAVRPFTVYGPFEAAARLVPSVCIAVAAGGAVELTRGGQTRDFVFIDDAVDAIVRAARAAPDEPLNVCSGASVSVRRVAEEIAAAGNRPVELRFGARPERAVDYPTLSGDPTRARKVLGWSATTELQDGLRRSLEWFAERSPVTGAVR